MTGDHARKPERAAARAAETHAREHTMSIRSRWLAGLGCLLALSGCKTEFGVEVPLSQLLDPAVTQIPGTVRFEIPGCDSYEDSRNPSSSLVKAQEQVPTIFPQAEFKSCYQQKLTSWAEFSLPVAIDRDGDAETFVSTDTLSLTSDPRRLLGLAIPPAVLERIDKVQRENLGPTPEYEVRLQVINDLGRDVDTAVLASWLDDDPITFGSVNFAQGETRSLRLSNVLIDRAMQKGEATILVDMDQEG